MFIKEENRGMQVSKFTENFSGVDILETLYNGTDKACFLIDTNNDILRCFGDYTTYLKHEFTDKIDVIKAFKSHFSSVIRICITKQQQTKKKVTEIINYRGKRLSVSFRKFEQTNEIKYLLIFEPGVFDNDETVDSQIESSISNGYQFLFENIDFGLLMIDNSFLINKVNQWLVNQLHLSNELKGKYIHELKVNLYNEFYEDVLSVFENKLPVQREVEIEQNWYLVKIAPCCDFDNELKGVIVTFVEINDIKEVGRLRKLTTELKNKKDALQTANKALEQFAFSTSHDLKEPLRSINSFIQLIKRRDKDNLSEESLEYIDFVTNNCQRMFWLIEGIITFTKIGTDSLEINAVQTNVVLEKVLKSFEYIIGETNSEVQYSFLPDVIANDILLTILFENLISNALKFVPQGRKPVIKINSIIKKDKVIFSVKDNGSGIPTEFKETIFQMFKQLSSEQRFSGAGVGLATCKRIIYTLNGEIWFDSVEGEGSTFYFSLPAYLGEK